MLEKACKLQPGNADTCFALGDTLRALDRKADAVAAYRKYLELETGNAAFRSMAVTWIRNLSG